MPAPATNAGRRPGTAVRSAVFLACLSPMLWMALQVARGDLGPDPVARLTHETGIWALRLLLLSLAMTPLRRLTGSPWPLRLRRMIGLFAFAYALLHLLVYVALDLQAYWPQLLEDLVKRPFITVGAAALVLLVPLALTSTRAMQRRLGRRWRPLHRLVYPAVLLACLHFLWLVKADWREPAIHLGIALLLLALRLPPLARVLTRHTARDGPAA
ncbi:MAG: sulfoxide reductase heme-binding subunit YedZ [Xanthomonadales bacterium]|nr:sulfoxide reductase heme-binding subunit YedZ [Xanthomonadales bacterium]